MMVTEAEVTLWIRARIRGKVIACGAQRRGLAKVKLEALDFVRGLYWVASTRKFPGKRPVYDTHLRDHETGRKRDRPLQMAKNKPR